MLRIVALATACSLLSACGSDSGSTTQDNQTASVASATATPAVPNGDELAGRVTRFYRDLGEAAKGSSDLGAVLSSSFLASDKNWTRDYGFIDHPRVNIDGTNGSTVDYTVDYDYLIKGGGMLSWERVGTWSFVHGRLGWQLDKDAWKSVRILSETFADGSHFAVADKTYSDGHHVFNLPLGPPPGMQVAFTATNTGWETHAISVPTLPTTAYQAQAPVVTTAPYQPSYAPNPGAGDAGCQEVTVEGIYHDGAVLHLLDGRYLRVSDVDTVTSSVWVAPLEGVLCDDKFTYTDDDESVDIEPS